MARIDQGCKFKYRSRGCRRRPTPLVIPSLLPTLDGRQGCHGIPNVASLRLDSHLRPHPNQLFRISDNIAVPVHLDQKDSILFGFFVVSTDEELPVYVRISMATPRMHPNHLIPLAVAAEGVGQHFVARFVVPIWFQQLPELGHVRARSCVGAKNPSHGGGRLALLGRSFFVFGKG